MITILIVEDDEANARIAEVICQAAGYEVVTATQGQEALDLLRERPIDLVLADVRLPVLDGHALTRSIKADPRTAGIPVIALTAAVMPSQREAMTQAGADAFVAKPYRRADLLAAIARMLER